MFWKSANRSSTDTQFKLAASSLASRLYSKAFVTQKNNEGVLQDLPSVKA